MNDGTYVSYIGTAEGLAVGDEGRVLHAVRGGAHVMFTTGARKDELIFVPDSDLVSCVPSGRKAASVWDDSLSDGTLITHAAREVYDSDGERGLLSALNEEGLLAMAYSRAEEAVDSVAQAVRQDPRLHEVLSQLDSDEVESFVSTTARVLIREACRGS